MTIFRFRGETAPTEASRASVLEPALVDDGAVAELYLYDPIDSWGGWWGVSAKEFHDALAAIPEDAGEIRLHINSPGGELWDAYAIVNQLRQHKARVVAYVDGIAASAATLLTSTADETVMGVGAQLMIHDAWNIAIGNEQDLLDVAARLGKDSDAVARIYAQKAGGSADDWRGLMRAETWYTAEEAVAAGLADVAVGGQDTEKARALMSAVDLSLFRYAGRAEAPAPHVPHEAGTAALASAPAPVSIKPPAEPGFTTNRKESDVSDTLMAGLRERLGATDAEIGEDGILAALTEALAEQADDKSAAAYAAPAGTVLVDQAAYDALCADAAAGHEARDQQVAEQRQAAVDAAVASGRIAPARAEHWVKALEADPGAVDVLNALPEGTVPVEPKGFVGGVTEASDDDALYGALYTKEA